MSSEQNKAKEIPLPRLDRALATLLRKTLKVRKAVEKVRRLSISKRQIIGRILVELAEISSLTTLKVD